VTVLTSHYEPSLPFEELMDDVNVVRAPVMARVSKGVIMPTLGMMATKYMWQHDVLSLHLPQLDAAGIAVRARLFGRPSVLTYHSDLLLPPSLVNNVAGAVVNASNNAAAGLCDLISAYTDDFAAHSPFLSRYRDRVRVIAPPVEIPIPDEAAVKSFRERYGLVDKTVIGVGGRFAAEKGLEYLLEALDRIAETFPDVMVVHAGPREAIGESATFASWSRFWSGTKIATSTSARLVPGKWQSSSAPATSLPCPASTAPRLLAWCRSSRCCAARRWWPATCPACACRPA
jgi:glycosyltransferase involved in cell wall biosynthesis